jgi:hypothetical protein
LAAGAATAASATTTTTNKVVAAEVCAHLLRSRKVSLETDGLSILLLYFACARRLPQATPVNRCLLSNGIGIVSAKRRGAAVGRQRWRFVVPIVIHIP